MRRIICLLLCLCMTAGLSCALADRTPKPIEVVPYEDITPNLEGQHHYLLLCTDLWHANVRPADAPPPVQENGKRRDL